MPMKLKGLRLLAACGMVAAMGLSAGCETQSFFDPTEMGRFNQTPLVVPILKNLSKGIDEGNEQWAKATDVRESDLIVTKSDYAIGPNDTISVSITDLVGPGVETVKTARVSQSGMISLPLIDQIKASGLTEAQLEQAISQAYRDKNLIQNATVSVVTIEARARTFTIYGAVTQAAQYPIIEPDTRLLDALVMARDVTSPLGIDYVYVVRKLDQDVTEPAANPGPATAPTGPSPDLLKPRSEATPVDAPMYAILQPAETTMTQPAAASNTEGHIIVVDDKAVPADGMKMPPMDKAPAEAAGDHHFEFNDLKEPSDVRVIRVPLPALKDRGELKYNVVIRPGDMIIVPQPVIGEYYMGGHIARTGVYSLTARDITLRAAVVAAGGLDQLAMPHRTEITRKLGRFQQVFVRVDLSKIFNGEEPDILLKPDDTVVVGTNAIAPFLSAFRNSFRITYGFGFLYDRNFYP